MVKSDTRTIDGIQFIATGFPAFQSLKIKGRVLALLGVPLAKILSAMGAEKLGGVAAKAKALDVGVETLAPGLEYLLGHLDPDEFAQLCCDLMGNTIAITPDQGKFEMSKGVAAFDAVFSGRLGTLYKAIWLVLEVNDFFGLGSIIGKAVAASASQTTKQKPGSELPKES